MWVIVLSWRCWLQFKYLLVLLCYYPINNCIPQHVLHATAFLFAVYTKFASHQSYRIAIKEAAKDILFNKEREKLLVKHFTIFLIMRGKGLWQRIHCWGGTFSHKTGWLASVWTGILSELTLLNVLIDGCDPWALVRCVRMRAEVEPMEVQKSDELDEGVTWFSWFMSHVLLVHQEDDSLSLCCNFYN